MNMDKSGAAGWLAIAAALLLAALLALSVAAWPGAAETIGRAALAGGLMNAR